MRTILGAVVLMMVSACGGVAPVEFREGDAGQGVVDAGGEVDAGVPDAGSPLCADEQALYACAAAVRTEMTCCPTSEIPSPQAYCNRIAGNQSDPAVSCKDASALPCDAFGPGRLCY